MISIKDILPEHIKLTSLSNENIIRELNKTYQSYGEKFPNQRDFTQVNVLYHIVIPNKDRNKELIKDGFYEIEEKNKFYTSIKGLIRFCNKEKLSISEFKIIEGYTERGENFK